MRGAAVAAPLMVMALFACANDAEPGRAGVTGGAGPDSGDTALVIDAPRLHFVDGPDLYFDDPSFIQGNHILKARFRER